MAKFVLQMDEPTPDYILIGVSCHQKDYRAAWAIGNSMGLEFARDEEPYTIVQKNGTKAYFTSFSYFPSQEERYLLLANKSEFGTLLPELTQFDFILLIYSLISDEEVEDLVKQIRSHSLIQFCSLFNGEQMKHASRLPIF
ncbi:MAG: IPExxxVDY family protein [Bacteroidia bacterium]|nr:IPExxxVDY family protein [Bacteroidia bacterium]